MHAGKTIAVVDRTVQPEVKPFGAFDVKIPDRHVMNNGALLYIIDSDEADVTRIDLVFHAGRWHQAQPLQAVYALRMLKEGSRRTDYRQMAEKLDFYGAWVEHYVTHTVSVLTLYSLNKFLPQTLDLLEQMVKEPVFPEDRLHTIVETNIKRHHVAMQRTDCRAMWSLLAMLFGSKHPEGHIANEADFRAIGRETLSDFAGQHLQPDNMSVYLSGKVSDDCIRRVEGIFGNTGSTAGHTSSAETFHMPEPEAEKHLFIEKDGSQQSSVAMGLLTIGVDNPDFCKLRIAVTVLGGYFGSRLMSNIREDKGYTYDITSSLISCPGNNILAIRADCSNAHTDALIAEVYHEMERLQQERVPDEEVETVRSYMLGECMRNSESAFTLADLWIMSNEQLQQPDSFMQSVEAIRTVTADDVQQMAQRYFRKDLLKEVVCGRKK